MFGEIASFTLKLVKSRIYIASSGVSATKRATFSFGFIAINKAPSESEKLFSYNFNLFLKTLTNGGCTMPKKKSFQAIKK